MAVSIFYVRHGQSEANLDGFFYEEETASLTELGRLQAINLGHRLKLLNLHFDAIYSSPLERAKETCRITLGCAGLDYKKVIIDNRLRERKSLSPSTHSFYPEQIESAESLERRVRSFLEDVKREYNEKTILIFAHGLLGDMFYHVTLRNAIQTDRLSMHLLKNGEMVHLSY